MEEKERREKYFISRSVVVEEITSDKHKRAREIIWIVLFTAILTGIYFLCVRFL